MPRDQQKQSRFSTLQNAEKPNAGVAIGVRYSIDVDGKHREGLNLPIARGKQTLNAMLVICN
jgi:hypothetical protein